MKKQSPNQMSAYGRTTGVACALAVLSIVAAMAAEPDSRELREPPGRPNRDTPAPGEQSNRGPDGDAVRNADALQSRAERRRERMDFEATARPRVRELNVQLDKAMAELKELRAAGKDEQALVVKRRIQELEMQLEQAQRDRVPPPGEPPRPREGQRIPPGEPDTQRLRHLEIAIDNLHAAGMHELADRLALQTKGPRENPPDPRRPGAPRLGAAVEIQRLQAEIQELRRNVVELRDRVEELSRERK